MEIQTGDIEDIKSKNQRDQDKYRETKKQENLKKNIRKQTDNIKDRLTERENYEKIDIRTLRE